MSSGYFVEVEKELEAMQQQLQAKQEEIDRIINISEEMKAQKQNLHANSAELNEHHKEIVAAMRSIAVTEETVKDAIDDAVRSDHMVVSDIVKLAVTFSAQIHGGSRDDVLSEVMCNIFDGKGTVQAALVSAVTVFLGVEEAMKYTITFALKNGWSEASLKEILKRMATIIDEGEFDSQPDKNDEQAWGMSDLGVGEHW